MADLAPVHEDTANVHDWLVLPVFFATTRKRVASKSIDFSEEGAEKGLMFGVKNVVVPAPDKVKVSDETMKKMGWQLIHLEKPLADGKKPEAPDPEKCPVADHEYKDKDVVGGFDQYRDQSGKKKVAIFVHGCCATFQASLERAAKLAAHMQIPVVVFDWDSPKGFTKYLANETTAEQCLDDYYDFLTATETMLPAANTILIGHSMGARFLDNALVRRAERARLGIPYKKYAEIIFSQPDIDARSYIRHNQAVVEQGEKTRIYFNTTDGRLDASATAHGFERLGRPGPLLEQLCSVQGQDMVDITQCAMGHEIPFWVVGDLSNDQSTESGGFACKEEGAHHFVLHRLANSAAKPD